MKSYKELINGFDLSVGFNIELVREIQKQPATYIPLLIEILEMVANDPSIVDENEDFAAHLYAFFLLGEFKVKEAFPVLLKLCKLDDLDQELIFDDFATGELSALLSVTCPDPQILIDEIILNEAGNEWVRGAAINAFYVMFWEGVISRDQLIDHYSQIFEKLIADQQYNVWSCLVSNCCEVCPVELEEQCRKAVASGNVDPIYVRESAIAERIALGVEQCLEDGRENQQLFIKDTSLELAEYNCFSSVDLNSMMSERFQNYLKSGKI